MLFNSLEFIIFLPIIFILYWFCFNKKLNHQNIILLVASYFFYGWWSWKFLWLLILSTVIDYCYGFWVASPNPRKAKLFLILSITNNLAVLGIFKYYNFFAIQFQKGFELLGLNCNPVILKVALPIGISFYTFHGMSYVIDIYRKNQRPTKSFVDYAVFVSFFPLLVAGPIERANHLLPQIQKKRTFNYIQTVYGFRLILWGMFKKVVIADSLAVIVDDIFINYQDQTGLTLIIGAIAFSFQIYGDFSGYSDIALGTANLFGFELLSNFKFPYLSRDIAEFWRRWHISLSSWFKDYLYIPLGGSKNNTIKTIRNTFIIFIVSGFWHGAQWNFIAWGLIHAFGFLPLLLVNRNRKNINDVVAQNKNLPNLKELYQMITTFFFVTFAWIFFRSDGIRNAINYIKQIGFSIVNQPNQLLTIPSCTNVFYYITPLIIGDWYLRHNERKLLFTNNKKIRIIIYWSILIIIYNHLGNDQTFIYFQF